MPHETYIINPALDENIALIVALMKSTHGENPGISLAFDEYQLTNDSGVIERYTLTMDVCQFIADCNLSVDVPEIRIDIVEPSSEARGTFGSVSPVVKSIIFQDGQPVFDSRDSYIVKKIAVNNEYTDKQNKPNRSVRAALREQYMASQIPTLAAFYQLIRHTDHFYLHMKRAPGYTLGYYVDKLNAEQFLNLAYTLLKEVPAQIHQRVQTGKRMGQIIVHRDLKFENIMAAYNDKTKEWTISVVDFGLAKTMVGGKYSSLKASGNKMVYTNKMFIAAQEHKEIIYSKQTDLYALFTMIIALSGVKGRWSLKNKEQLKQELQTPNLTGLGNNMDLTPEALAQLKELFSAMLCNDEEQSASLEKALNVFNTLLNNYQSTLSPEVTPIPMGKPAHTTAEELKKCLEQDLEQSIEQKILKKISKQSTLQHWIRHYRFLSSSISPEEQQRFELMKTSGELSITSRHINNLIRFQLMAEYSDSACARILIRHEQGTAQLMKPVLGATQAAYAILNCLYINITRTIPLQLTREQHKYCEQILLHFKEIDSVLSKKTPIKDETCYQKHRAFVVSNLQLPFEEWFANLSQIIESTHTHGCIALLLSDILKAVTSLKTFKPDFSDKVMTWAYALLEKNNNLLLCENTIFLRSDLINHLRILKMKESQYAEMYKAYPQLDNSFLNWDKVRSKAALVDIMSEDSVIEVIGLIKSLIALANLYNKIHAPGYLGFWERRLHGTDAEWFKQQFRQLMEQPFSQEELNSKVAQMSEHAELIMILTEHIERINASMPFPAVEKALKIVMYEKTCPSSLKGTLQFITPDNASSLNEELALLLNDCPEGELNERLLSTMQRFCFEAQQKKETPPSTTHYPGALFYPNSVPIHATQYNNGATPSNIQH